MYFVRRCGLGTVTCEEAGNGLKVLEACCWWALMAPAFFLGHFVSLGLFGTFYLNASKFTVFRSKHVLFLAPISEFTFMNFVKKGLLYATTRVRHPLRNMDGNVERIPYAGLEFVLQNFLFPGDHNFLILEVVPNRDVTHT